MKIIHGALASLLIASPLSAQWTPTPSLAAVATSDCETFQRWFQRQPGSQLVLHSENDFYEKSARPSRPDTILNYSAFPLSHDQASWYKAMKHYRKDVGNGRCLSGFYDSAHKTALIYAQYGTASELTVTTSSSAPTGLPISSAPNRTRNGVLLGMTIAEVKAIDGSGTLHSDGRSQRLTYNQDFRTAANVPVTAYLGFLFTDGRLVAMDVGGGV